MRRVIYIIKLFADIYIFICQTAGPNGLIFWGNPWVPRGWQRQKNRFFSKIKFFFFEIFNALVSNFNLKEVVGKILLDFCVTGCTHLYLQCVIMHQVAKLSFRQVINSLLSIAIILNFNLIEIPNLYRVTPLINLLMNICSAKLRKTE